MDQWWQASPCAPHPLLIPFKLCTVGDTLAEAREGALHDCRKSGGDCRLVAKNFCALLPPDVPVQNHDAATLIQRPNAPPGSAISQPPPSAR